MTSIHGYETAAMIEACDFGTIDVLADIGGSNASLLGSLFPDIDRNTQAHLGFGAGKHLCLGSQMARLVTNVAMRHYLRRIPDYRLRDRFDWVASSNFRSPFSLPFQIG